MNRRPALELLALLAAGVALARWGSMPGGPWALALFALVAVAASWALRRNLLFAVAVPLGWTLAAAHLAPPEGPHRIREDEVGRDVRVEGVLTRDAALLEAKGRLHLLVTEIRTEAGRRAVRESVVAYLRGRLPSWSEGTRLAIDGRLERPHNLRNPGAWDYEAYLAREGVRFVLMGAAGDAEALHAPEGEALGLVRGAVVALRAKVKAFLAGPATEGVAPEVVSVLRALIVGDRAAFSETLYERFQATGTAHVLAISGMHLGIVGFLAFRLIKGLLKLWPPLLLRISVRKWAMVAALVPTLGYALLTGLGVSTARAAVMAVAFVLMLVLERENDPLSALGIAGIVLLAARPLDLFSTSFQLSFASVLAILLWSPALFGARPPLPLGLRPYEVATIRAGRAVREMFLISLVTDVATAPLIAAHFQRLTWIGPIANLIVIPLVGFVILPLGLLSGLAATFAPALAEALLAPAAWAAEAVVGWISFLDAVPARSISLPGPSMVGILGAYVALAGLAPALRPFRGRLVAAGASLALVALVPALAARIDRERPGATFLEFDRGEVAWLETARGDGVLVYGGVRRGSHFDAGRRVVFPFLADAGVRTIDHLVLPARADRRALGVDFLSERFAIGRRWCPGPRADEDREGEGPCAALEGPRAPLRTLDGVDGLLWTDGAGGAVAWFAGPVRKRGPAGADRVAALGAAPLVQVEWDPWSRALPALDGAGAAVAGAMVVTGESPEDVCERALAARWRHEGSPCARTAAEGAVRARWSEGGGWRLEAAP